MDIVENRRGRLYRPFLGLGDIFSKSYDENHIRVERQRAGCADPAALDRVHRVGASCGPRAAAIRGSDRITMLQFGRFRAFWRVRDAGDPSWAV